MMRRPVHKRRFILPGLILLAALALLAEGLMFREWPQKNKPLPDNATEYDHSADEREVLLISRTWYGVQLGVYSTQSGAQTAQNALDFDTIQLYHDAKYRVLCNVYTTKEEAAARVSQIKTEKGQDACLFVIASPVLQLRLSGQKGQLDVIEAGLQFLPVAVNSLLKGENLSDIARQGSLLCELLEGRFQANNNKVLSGLRDYCFRLCSAEQITEKEKMGFLMDIIAFLEEISQG